MKSSKSKFIRSFALLLTTCSYQGLLLLSEANFSPVAAQTTSQRLCAAPGKDGAGNNLAGIINTYYPGTANVNAGATSIPVGTSTGAPTQIQDGDLLLVIQMQGADINSTNSNAYGDGIGGDVRDNVDSRSRRKSNIRRTL